ncbi:mechanosensitive ion channel family protein [archaeon]|nr:mechanosensitive ion channel family protein [archaeon]
MIDINLLLNSLVFRVLLIVIGTYILSKIVKKVIDNFANIPSRKKTHVQFSFLKHLFTGFIYLIGIGLIVYIIPPLRTISMSVFASAGLLAVILGFAAQQAFSNIISGIFIAIFRPFKVGDRIKLQTNIVGNVEDITLRHTIILTFENKRIVIPNSVISNEIIENSSLGDEKICKFIEIGISYDSNIKKAKKIMQQEAMKHKLFLDNRTKQEKEANEPAVIVRVLGFGDSSVNLRAYVWSKTPSEAFKMGCDLNESIKERFDNEGIEIPFPYRTIVHKEMNKK